MRFEETAEEDDKISITDLDEKIEEVEIPVIEEKKELSPMEELESKMEDTLVLNL